MKGVIIVVEDGRVPVEQLEAEIGQTGGKVVRNSNLGRAHVMGVEWGGTEDALEGAVERVLTRADAESASVPSLDAVERRHITRVLSAAHGNKTLAARILGIDRKTLHRKLTQYARAGDSPLTNGSHQAFQG